MKDYFEVIPTKTDEGWHWCLREYMFDEELGEYATKERQGTEATREAACQAALTMLGEG